MDESKTLLPQSRMTECEPCHVQYVTSVGNPDVTACQICSMPTVFVAQRLSVEAHND